MTAVLVSLAEMQRFLGDVPSSDDTLIQELLDETENLFLGECNRRDRPFIATADTVARTEVHDGTGTRILTLHYPIAASGLSTDITLGLDTSDPDDTLEYDDVETLVWVAGSRTIERTDGGIWGYRGVPRYVHVTYKAAADVPESAALGIKRVVAALYRQRGSEDASRESLSGYSRDVANAMDDPMWKRAIANAWEPRFV